MQATLADAGTVVSVSRPTTNLGIGDRGCSSIGDEEGSTRISRSAQRVSRSHVPFTRPCSAHAARRSNSPGSLPLPRRAPSSAPSSPRKRRRPRKGYAERVDRRHGSLASSHGRYDTRPRSSPDAGGLRQRTRQAELAKGGNARSGGTRWRDSPVPAGGANHLSGLEELLHGTRSRVLSRRQTRTEAGASRGGGFTARGRARASNMRCRDR